MRELEIYMATHKRVPAPTDSHYIPIQAGCAVAESLDILRDDTGDNISERNKYYSELTVQYWIWKNSSAKAVGLVHYRRFFSAKNYHTSYNGKDIASGLDLLNELENSNFIVSNPLTFYHENTMISRSVEDQYVNTHHGFDLLQLRRVIADLHASYLPAFDFVMRNNKLIGFNLLVTTKPIFDEYSKWLFSILFCLESFVPLPSVTGYQARVMAFLSERLFTTWAAHNRKDLRFDYRPYVFFEGI